MDLGVSGKVALVTAASKGLGRASVPALAQDGARLVISSRGEAALREAERTLAAHTEVLAILADVTQPEAPQRLVDAAVQRFGGLDILVGNAGGPPAGTALEVDDAAILGAVNANLLSSVRLVAPLFPTCALLDGAGSA